MSPAALGRGELLGSDFFERSVHDVARELIGCSLRFDGVGGTIVETESYERDDPACHAYVGLTARTAVLFGPPARAYVYLSYGVHSLLNFVCEPDGSAAAVLVRALEPRLGPRRHARAPRSRARGRPLLRAGQADAGSRDRAGSQRGSRRPAPVRGAKGGWRGAARSAPAPGSGSRRPSSDHGASAPWVAPTCRRQRAERRACRGRACPPSRPRCRERGGHPWAARPVPTGSTGSTGTSSTGATGSTGSTGTSSTGATYSSSVTGSSASSSALRAA